MISYSAKLSLQEWRYCQGFLIVMRLKPAIPLHRQPLAGAHSTASFASPYESLDERWGAVKPGCAATVSMFRIR